MKQASFFRTFSGSAVALSLVLALAPSPADAAATRLAKDAGERHVALAAAAKHLQSQGFVDPMETVEPIEHRYLAVVLNPKAWKRMAKEQKLQFLNTVNNHALHASEGVAVEMQFSIYGDKVAVSAYEDGKQVIRFFE